MSEPQHHEDWITASDGRQIFYRATVPPKKPKAILLVVHGLSEHSGRYRHVMDHFAALGLACYAPDHRGHGRSAITLGDLESMDAVVGDLGVLHRHAITAYPGLPVCVLGHSMGGLISVLYTERTDEVHALITNGVAMDIPDDVPRIKIKAAGLLGKLVPRLGVEAFYNPDRLTRDAHVKAKVEADPLFYKGWMRARTGDQLLRSIPKAIAGLNHLTVPLLVTHGASDETVPPRASEILFGGAASKDKTLHFFEGLLHEVHNEPEREDVMKLWSDWLLERL
ncbi:MAG: lysophospholipase [Alphaproteobacteria bacterium]|nr:lysophospholipase [Alphaproteobacteria bacterium]